MVKRITVTLDDEEFEEWKNLKGGKSWYEFFKELIKAREEVESVAPEIVKARMQELCLTLASLASACPSQCKREEALLRVCASKADRDTLLKAFVIISNVLEEQLDEYSSWLAKLLKASIIEAFKGNAKGARELLEKLCSK